MESDLAVVRGGTLDEMVSVATGSFPKPAALTPQQVTEKQRVERMKRVQKRKADLEGRRRKAEKKAAQDLRDEKRRNRKKQPNPEFDDVVWNSGK